MRENKSDYIFNLANRAYFDKSVNLNPCVEKILSSELHVVDMTKVSTRQGYWSYQYYVSFHTEIIQINVDYDIIHSLILFLS